MQEYVAQLGILNEDEKSDTARLLESVKETREMPIVTPSGTGGRYMQPHVSNIAGNTGRIKKLKHGDERKVLLICIPYFHLAPYYQTSSLVIPSAHPMRSLIQSSYEQIPKHRDLKQAVCNVAQSRKGSCYHVPQIWCLVINRSTATSSPEYAQLTDL